MIKHFEETLYNNYAQRFSVDEIYYENKTEHQHLIIFHNAKFGRVMVLDGIIQTTERDEFIYHEMLCHVPIFAHGAVERVLIVGGGDGGMLREVLRHSGVKKVTMVEIDETVIEISKKYLPNHAQGAFDDPRFQRVISDGATFVRETHEKFDVVITDSTDPIGPGESLFSHDYYEGCKNCLTENGILVTQNGVAFFQAEEAKKTADLFRQLFKDWHFYSAAVPTYVGGIMVFGWGTDNPQLRKIPLETLEMRYHKSRITTQYYNPSIHQAAFALPQSVLENIGKTDTTHERAN
ncbi:Spermidine synthase [hydrothermal vent metagenome]|uniref:Spermidine synthase n=1 Tax=hydrothermal vent metagenome TaxID=652676 RepID=A0A3B1CQL1_9ZZZZ